MKPELLVYSSARDIDKYKDIKKFMCGVKYFSFA